MSFVRQIWDCKECRRKTFHHVKAYDDGSGKPGWVIKNGVRAFERNKFCDNVDSHKNDCFPITTYEITKEDFDQLIGNLEETQSLLTASKQDLEQAFTELRAHREFRERIRKLANEES